MLTRRLAVVSEILAVVSVAAGCRGDPTTVLDRLDEARKVAAELRLNFSKAADASNRTVMAKSEDTSRAFAQEAELASSSVERDVASLTRLLGSLNYAKEAEILKEFSAHLSEYQRLDRSILALAVENTNLEAQALSFGPASQAAATFRDALQKVAPSVAAKDRCRAEGLVAQAVLSVREIQVLHAPHIAERDELPMNRMEKEMADWDTKATSALTSLEELAAPNVRPAVAEARSALTKFQSTSKQIVELSRRNTNVLALDLSLRQKPALIAACDERIRALQDALAKEGPKSTR